MDSRDIIEMTIPKQTGLLHDTTPEAEAAYWARIAAMTPQERLAQSARLTRRMREITTLGIRTRHPEYSEEQVKLALQKMVYGEELFYKLHPELRSAPCNG